MAATLPLASLAVPSAYDLGLLAAMGALQLGIGLFLFMRGAPHLTAAQVGLLSLLEVILAPIWVWLAFDEVPAPLSLIGGAVVLVRAGGAFGVQSPPQQAAGRHGLSTDEAPTPVLAALQRSRSSIGLQRLGWRVPRPPAVRANW